MIKQTKKTNIAKNNKIMNIEKTSLICVQADGGVWQEGCLVKTCNSGTVEESLADECVELIEKKVEKILGERLAEKGSIQHIATKNEQEYLSMYEGIECPTKNGELAEAGKYQTPGKVLV